MKINAKQALKTFEGEEFKAEDKLITIGQIISNILVRSKSSDPMRNYVLGQKFYTDEEIELNQSDLDFVTKSVKETELYNPIFTGQILLALSKKDK